MSWIWDVLCGGQHQYGTSSHAPPAGTSRWHRWWHRNGPGRGARRAGRWCGWRVRTVAQHNPPLDVWPHCVQCVRLTPPTRGTQHTTGNQGQCGCGCGGMAQPRARNCAHAPPGPATSPSTQHHPRPQTRRLHPPWPARVTLRQMRVRGSTFWYNKRACVRACACVCAECALRVCRFSDGVHQCGTVPHGA